MSEIDIKKDFYEIINCDDIIQENDLPIIISDTAKMFYKTVSETKISRGKNRIGIIPACNREDLKYFHKLIVSKIYSRIIQGMHSISRTYINPVL